MDVSTCIKYVCMSVCLFVLNNLLIVGPQLVISVYSATALQGYGRVHAPFQPGLHSLNVPLSKPAPTTYLGYFASFFGYQPELVQASLLASGEGSHCKCLINII